VHVSAFLSPESEQINVDSHISPGDISCLSQVAPLSKKAVTKSVSSFVMWEKTVALSRVTRKFLLFYYKSGVIYVAGVIYGAPLRKDHFKCNRKEGKADPITRRTASKYLRFSEIMTGFN
jgi:hypothetical protein